MTKKIMSPFYERVGDNFMFPTFVNVLVWLIH